MSLHIVPTRAVNGLQAFARLSVAGVVALGLGWLGVPPAVAAIWGQIAFDGQVSAFTCQVEVEGVPSPTLLLPAVRAGAFHGVGSVAGERGFRLTLSGCDASAGAGHIETRFVMPYPTVSGNLRNLGSAHGVELQILDGPEGKPIGPGDGVIDSISGSGRSKQAVASHDFVVRYYASSLVVSAGTVRSEVRYVIRYR